MSKTYRPYEPAQMFLMPPSVEDWLPRGHLAHFVADVVEDLDLSARRRWTGKSRSSWRKSRR